MKLYILSGSYDYGECTTIEGAFSSPEKGLEYLQKKYDFFGLPENITVANLLHGCERMERNGILYWFDVQTLDQPAEN